MSIVVLGNGILGSEIVKKTNWPSISRSINGFDIRNKETYPFYFLDHNYKPKFNTILNCIAYTDTYSDNKQLHWDINFKSVVDLSDFCSKYNIKLIHTSTDYVYINSIDEASEEDVPIHGNNWYSYTKLLGDSYVQLNKNNLILRGTHKPFPFPYEKAWINQIGNFDYVHCVCEIIIKLIDKKATGIYNIGTEIKTMFDLAIKSNDKVIPTMISNNKIPKNVTMNINKLRSIL
jgi:dTDP-4-dehydrorhamnose reductase